MAEVPIRLPLTVQPNTRNGSLGVDGEIFNAFFVRDGEKVKVQNRYGLATVWNAAPYGPQGIYNSTFGVFGVAGDTLYSLVNFTPNWINPTGTVAALSEGSPTYLPVTFSSGYATGESFAIVIQSVNALCYYAPFVSLTMQQATGPNIPTGINPLAWGVQFLNGFYFIMDTNTIIHGSTNINDPTTWSNNLNNIPAISNLDGAGVALSQQDYFLLAHMALSTKVFYYANNPYGSPLSWVSSVEIPYGCLNGYSVQNINNEVFWLSATTVGKPVIIRLTNLSPKEISTGAITRILQSYGRSTGYQNVWSFSTSFNGSSFYCLTIGSNLATQSNANITLVYDLDLNVWYVWQNYLGYNLKFNSSASPLVSPVLTAGFGGLGNLMMDGLTGAIETFVPGSWKDLDGNYTMDLYTDNFTGNTNQGKVLERLDVIGDQNGVGVVKIQWSDDDYQTWGPWMTVDMTTDKPMLTQLGNFTRRAFHVQYTANSAIRLEALDLWISPAAI